MESENLLRKKIIGALSGLSKACNMHMRTENTTGVILYALMASHPLSGMTENELEDIICQVHDEKRAVAPGCASCVSKCGNTDDYDLGQIDEEDSQVGKLKYDVISRLQEKALDQSTVWQEGKLSGEEEDYFYKALCAISYDMDAERYERFL